MDSIEPADSMDSIDSIESSLRLGREGGWASPFSILLTTSCALRVASCARLYPSPNLPIRPTHDLVYPALDFPLPPLVIMSGCPTEYLRLQPQRPELLGDARYYRANLVDVALEAESTPRELFGRLRVYLVTVIPLPSTTSPITDDGVACFSRARTNSADRSCGTAANKPPLVCGSKRGRRSSVATPFARTTSSKYSRLAFRPPA